MSSVPEDKRIEQVDQPEPRPDEHLEQYLQEEPVEVKYRSLNPLAVLSVVFGVLSILTVFTWFFGLIPLAGLVLGFLALRQIDEAPEETTGRGLARAGMGLCVGLWVLGSYLFIAWRNEVPFGYTSISYADLQPDQSVPGQMLPKKAIELDGRRIFLKGYMYPGRQSIAIKSFIMVPTRAHCKFCAANMPSTELVRVELVGDLTADFKSSLVGIGGKLVVDPAAGPGDLPYRVEADCFR